MSSFTPSDLDRISDSLLAVCRVNAHFTRDFIGGQPGGEPGVRAFVEHHLHLVGEEAEQAVHRILHEEVGERCDTPDTGEVKEEKVYGVNVIRRTTFGPYIGDWQIKACLKASASRLGLFMQKKGSKGDMAEFGSVRSSGISLADGMPYAIHLIGPDGGPAKTEFKQFMGSVQGPSGRKSIVHNSETVPAGTRFEFEFRLPDSSKLTENDLAQIFSMSRTIGLGSVKALENGKFEIDSLDIDKGK